MISSKTEKIVRKLKNRGNNIFFLSFLNAHLDIFVIIDSRRKKEQKMKKQIKELIINILKIIGFFLLYAAVASLIYLIFYLNGYRTLDDIRVYIDNAGAWAWLIFSIIEIFTTVVLFVIPAQTTAFIFLALALFNPIEAFFIVAINTLIASTINFSLGKLFGKIVVKRIVGVETLQKYRDKLEKKAMIYYPIMMLFPFFPDDEITLIAGLTKMKYRYFMPVTFITRSIGIAAYTFVGQIFDFYTFNVLEWYQFILISLIGIALVFYVAHKLEIFLENRPINK